MKKKKKISLAELEVQSFVTRLEVGKKKLVGGVQPTGFYSRCPLCTYAIDGG